MKRLIQVLFTLILLFSPLNAITLTKSSPMAQKAISTLQKLAQYPALIKEIEKNGPIKLEMANLKDEQFDAFWDSTNRTIRINLLKNEKFDVLIVSILFELHNAKSDLRFKELYTKAKFGQITKEKYVEEVERMEHQNALSTSLIIDNGIKIGLLNEEARWPILKNFDDHYALQQLKDHSQWIANNYDSMSPKRKVNYIGTLPKITTPQDKADMIRYLEIKNDVEAASREKNIRGTICLKKEYESLENCYTGKVSNCVRTKERIALLEHVFKNNPTFQALIQGSPMYLAKNSPTAPSIDR